MSISIIKLKKKNDLMPKGDNILDLDAIEVKPMTEEQKLVFNNKVRLLDQQDFLKTVKRDKSDECEHKNTILETKKLISLFNEGDNILCSCEKNVTYNKHNMIKCDDCKRLVCFECTKNIFLVTNFCECKESKHFYYHRNHSYCDKCKLLDCDECKQCKDNFNCPSCYKRYIIQKEDQNVNICLDCYDDMNEDSETGEDSETSETSETDDENEKNEKNDNINEMKKIDEVDEVDKENEMNEKYNGNKKINKETIKDNDDNDDNEDVSSNLSEENDNSFNNKTNERDKSDRSDKSDRNTFGVDTENNNESQENLNDEEINEELLNEILESNNEELEF